MRLEGEGYDVELRDGYLIVKDVPYVTSDRTVARGQLVMPAIMAGDILAAPADHTAHFAGSEPCDSWGQSLSKVINSAQVNEFLPGQRTAFYFSAKPPQGNYSNYYEKVTTYVDLLSRWARLIDPAATALTHSVHDVPDHDDYPFAYRDSATSRAGTNSLNSVFRGARIAIVGLGGTGSHILDLVAKTPVAEIHLYDGDVFLNHNAFRAPGAADISDLRASRTRPCTGLSSTRA